MRSPIKGMLVFVTGDLEAGMVLIEMDPGVVNRIDALKASIPKGRLDGLVANASALSPAEILAMIGPVVGGSLVCLGRAD
jgi:hypothetical protein